MRRGWIDREDAIRFHHIGIACRDIEKERVAHRHLGFADEGEPFVDPIQNIRGRFMVNGPFRVELLEPLGKPSPLDQYLARGVKMYHQAFEVPELGAAMAQLRATGAILCGEPAPAVAFGGRRIVFLLLPSYLLVELIEAESAS